MRNVSLHGELPEPWPDRLPSLINLDVSFNPGVSGTIPSGSGPPSWTNADMPALAATCQAQCFIAGACPPVALLMLAVLQY